MEKVSLEEDCKNGKKKMMPEFESLHHLYEHKMAQQENLAKQLRIEQRLIKDNETDNSKQVREQCTNCIFASYQHNILNPCFLFSYFQRQMFLQLQKLMRLKRFVMKQEIEQQVSCGGNDGDSLTNRMTLDSY